MGQLGQATGVGLEGRGTPLEVLRDPGSVHCALPPADLGPSCLSDLPYGWEQETDENGQVYFVE